MRAEEEEQSFLFFFFPFWTIFILSLILSKSKGTLRCKRGSAVSHGGWGGGLYDKEGLGQFYKAGSSTD